MITSYIKETYFPRNVLTWTNILTSVSKTALNTSGMKTLHGTQIILQI